MLTLIPPYLAVYNVAGVRGAYFNFKFEPGKSLRDHAIMLSVNVKC